jgi:hypothetical protein
MFIISCSVVNVSIIKVARLQSSLCVLCDASHRSRPLYGKHSSIVLIAIALNGVLVHDCICTIHAICAAGRSYNWTLCLKLLLHYALSDPEAPPSSDMDYEKYVAQQEHRGKGGSATLGHFHEKVYV